MKAKLLLLSMLTICITLKSFSQMIVSGNIKGSTTEKPLSGVSVTIKGINKGTISDSKGNFSISVPGKNTVLVFSF